MAATDFSVYEERLKRELAQITGSAIATVVSKDSDSEDEPVNILPRRDTVWQSRLQSKINEIEEENRNLREATVDAAKKVRALEIITRKEKTKASEFRKIAKRLEVQRKKLTDENIRLENSGLKLNNDLSTTKQQLRETEKELSDMTIRGDTLSRLNEKLQTKKSAAKKSAKTEAMLKHQAIGEATTKFEALMREQTENFKSRESSLSTELSLSNHKVQELKAEKMVLSRQLQQKESESENYETTINSLEKTLAELRGIEQEKFLLTSQLEKVNKAKEFVTKKSEEHAIKLAQLQRDTSVAISGLRTAAAAEKAELGKIIEARDLTIQELDGKQQMVIKKFTEIREAMERNRTRLQHKEEEFSTKMTEASLRENDLKKQLKQQGKEYKELENNFHSLETDYNEIKYQLEYQKTLVKEIRKQYEQTDMELQNQKTNFDELEKEHKDLTSTVTLLGGKLRTIETGKNAELKEANELIASLKTTVGVLNEKCSKAEKEAQTNKEHADVIMMQLREVVDLSKSRDTVHKDVVVKLGNLQREFDENQVLKADLLKQTIELKANKESLTSDVEDLSTQLTNAKGDLGKSYILTQDLMKQKYVLEHELKEKKTALDEKQTEVNTLKYRLDTDKDLGEMAAFEVGGNLKTSKSTIKQLTMQANQSKLEIENLTLQINQLDQNVTFSKKREGNLQNRLNMKTMELEQIGEENTKLASQISQLRGTIQQMQSEGNLKIGQGNLELDELRGKFQASHSRVLELERENKDLRTTVAKNEGSNVNEEEIDSLRTEVDALQRDKKTLREMKDRLQSNLENVQKSSNQFLEERDLEVTNLRKDNLRKQLELDNMQIKVQRLEKRNFSNDAELGLMDRKEIETLVNTLRAEKGTISEQNNSLSKKLASLQNSMTQIEKGAARSENNEGRASVLDIIKSEKAANPDSFRSPPVFRKQVVHESEDSKEQFYSDQEESKTGFPMVSELPRNEIKKKLVPPPFNAVATGVPVEDHIVYSGFDL